MALSAPSLSPSLCDVCCVSFHAPFFSLPSQKETMKAAAATLDAESSKKIYFLMLYRYFVDLFKSLWASCGNLHVLGVCRIPPEMALCLRLRRRT